MLQSKDPAQNVVVSGNVPGTEPTNLTHYPALDGLRACAFLMVFLAHYYAMPWGFGGVNIFFVLSGFLITGILYDSRDRPGRARTFYLRRTFRIFPLYYGVLLSVLLVTPIFRWEWSWPWLAWPLYIGNFLRIWGHRSSDPFVLGQTYGWLNSARFVDLRLYFGHFWSLCVEEQFYLLWPWIIFYLRPRRILLFLCVAVVIAEPFLRSLVEGHSAAWVAGREVVYTIGLPFQLDALLLGALLALLWRGEHRQVLQSVASFALLVMTVLLAAYLVHAFRIFPAPLRLTYVYPSWRITYGLSLINFYGAALMVRALDPGSIVYRVLNNASLRALGRISYGAYVFHDLLHGVYIRIALHAIAFFHRGFPYIELEVAVLGFVGTLVIATLSFRYFETPFLRLKDRLAPSHKFSVGAGVGAIQDQGSVEAQAQSM